MKSTDYPVFLIYSSEDQAWLARVDLLPGCVADGETAEEALKNAQAAIEGWIETTKALGREVPPPIDALKMEELQAQAMQHQQQLIASMIQQAANQAFQAQLQGSRPAFASRTRTTGSFFINEQLVG